MAIRKIRKISVFISIFIMLTIIATSNSSAIYVQSSKLDTSKPSPSQTVPTLGILTRHESTLYNLVAAEFANSELGHSVGITSRDQIKFQTPATTELFENFIKSDKFASSVAWGGGPTIFNALADQGYLKPMVDTDLKNWIEGNISKSLAGATMIQYNDQNQLMWAASAISSFGFTVNHKTLEERGLPTPHTWEDLASPAFFTTPTENNIAMGNAPDTTSNTRIYQIILQKYGWEKGWEIIYSIAGNSIISGGSVNTRAQVISGTTAVAMTIDFYGLIAQQDNANTEYIIPENGSIVNGDPIALTNDANGNTTIGKAFIKFVESQYGQSLLLDKAVNRLPVRVDAFDTAIGKTRDDVKTVYDKTIANQGIQFNETLALAWLDSVRYHFQATITDVHDQLREAWRQMVTSYKNGGFPEGRFLQLREIFGKPAITGEEAQSINSQMLNDAFKGQKEADWQATAIQKYSDAISAINQPYTLSGVTGTGSNVKDSNIQDFPVSTGSIFFGLSFAAIFYFIKKKKRYNL